MNRPATTPENAATTHKKIRFGVRGLIAWLVLAVLAGGMAPAGVFAQASDWVGTDHTAVRLISAADAVGDADTVRLGLQFRLNDGWKIYWRSPGDAGFPPRVDWAGSSNLADARISWPAPVRFSILGMETVGYAREVVLPIAARLLRPGDPLVLRAVVDYLACSDICVPYTAHLALTLPAGPSEPGNLAHLISRYENRVPGDGAAHGLAIEGLTLLRGAPDAALRVTATSTLPFAEPDVFLEGPAELAFGSPQITLTNDGRAARLDSEVFGAASLEAPLEGSTVTVTLVDGDRGAERRVTVAPPAIQAADRDPAAQAPGPSYLVILGLGLLGGLILNLMPCVLPVLSIKLLGVVGHGGGDPRWVRLSFVASALGILFSFLVLAGALAAMKALGASVGWGLQFQQPWFLTAMILVMTLFACNLWGLFEVRLPRAVADAGIHAGHVHGLGGHFLTGALVTLLATPCSAPFLGTAVGFALSRGAVDIFAVFTALGLGLATPYLAVAAFPRLATMLPRPGPWMRVLRRILGFALAATGIWLLTVLAAEVGEPGGLIVGLLALAMALAIFAAGRSDHRLGRAGGWTAAAGVAVLALLLPTRMADRPPLPLNGAWIAFDEAAIPALVAEGRVVFVNVTADWCITCRVNETLVLSKHPVRDSLASDAVVAMRADWTRPDAEISAYLARFGRYGIPFDAVYGPGVPNGQALPELLTTEAVLGGLERAAGNGADRPPERAEAERF